MLYIKKRLSNIGEKTECTYQLWSIQMAIKDCWKERFMNMGRIEHACYVVCLSS
jgi:hypothetical protein